MLSIENPPPDPPCPCEQLKISSDERASDKVALQEADLLKSGLDDNNPLPKFSIRDYVFTTRSKDIKTNWPFSQKNLQLCLKHGVKDLLPPFQHIDSVRNRVIERCTVETSLIDKENISNSDGNPSGPSDHFVPVSSDNAGCNQKLAVDCVSIDLSGSEGDREIPLTTNNQSHSQIDSVPADRTPSAAVETNTSSEASGAKLKKCRLIVKVGTGADPSSNEDIAATFPEQMASKVCPVCKTFSSSSNTTLNAHIDQCLSVESTIKWTANSRVIKHRIKPRKTRLMVDIYATAPHCTLEELDRRNGTNWAMNSRLPTQETMEGAEEEKQRALSNFKDNGDEGAVYIDASGKKLRILSKFNDTSAGPKLEAEPGPQKTFSGRGNKLLSTYKKRHHAQKHHKYLKLAPQSKKFCSSKPRHTSQVRGGIERNFASEESSKNEESPRKPFKAQVQINPNDTGTITKWACSKRTGLLKRCNRKEGIRYLRCNFRQEFPVESDRLSLGDSYLERSCVQKTPNSSENLPSSPESSKRMDNPSFVKEGNEQHPVRKRVGFPSFVSQISGNMERFPEPPKRNVKQLRKDSASVDGSCKDFANYKGNHVLSPGKKPVEINTGPVQNSSHDVCSSLPRSHFTFSSKGTKFSSLRKHMSLNQSSVPESKYKLNRKCSGRKKSKMHCVAQFDKEVVALPSKVVQKHDSEEKNAENQSRIEEITDEVSLSRCGVLKIRKKRRAFGFPQKEQSVALKSALGCCNYDVGNNIDSSARVGGDAADTFDDIVSGRKGTQIHKEDIVAGPSSGMDVMGSVMSLGKSIDPEFHKLASPSNTLSGSLQSGVFKNSLRGAETLLCPTDPSSGDEDEMFCVNEVGKCMIAQNMHMGAEMDSEDAQGNYFTEVDPIPIPGPPGSFLPSPRDMGSEELQGNSSLTTSRVQSSEDHHDMVDRDSSDSPISAISTISNSTIARSGSKSSEKLHAGPHFAQDEIGSGLSGGSHDAVAENTAPAPQAATIRAERTNLDELKLKMIVPEKGPSSFRNDQPCCCSRKDGMFRGISLNYQESQLLRRRTMTSVPLPAMGKQLSCESNRRPYSLNSMPEYTSLGNFPSSGSEKVVLPLTKSAAGSTSVEVSADCALKSPVHGNFDSASPSASNPVLRLMGKNLMVVNNDENVSQQLRATRSGSLNDLPNPQFQTLSGVSPHNIQNEDFHPFHHMVHQDTLISGQSQCNTGFEVKFSNSFGRHVTSKTPQSPSHTPPGMFSSKNVGGGFTASLEPHEYKARYNLPNDPNISRNRPYTPLAYNTENFFSTPDTQQRNVDSTFNPMKEVIIIDDTPEGEADSAVDAPYSEGMRESRVSSAGISIPITANYNSRHVNPFHSYQPQDSSPYGGSPMVQGPIFQMPPHYSANANPIKWNCTSEDPSVLPPSSLMASSSSKGHLRSSLYYSSSFS